MAKLIYDYYKESANESYKIENEILDTLNNSSNLDELLLNDKRWEIQYNLNPARINILNVCDIKSSDSCLEIGAECGAISKGILQYTEHLDSVEESKIKCLINEKINHDHNDFNIFVGKFNDVILNKKYDKIFFICSLEYAKFYFPNELNPYEYMLEKVKKLLNKDGIIYIAIDNKYGMKYLSGAINTNSNNYFEEIEGKETNSKQFSFNEIKIILNKDNLNNNYFYFPLPDYKFPIEIYSEDYTPNNHINYLGHSFDKDRFVFFNESKAILEASKNNDFPMFANSFMIEVR